MIKPVKTAEFEKIFKKNWRTLTYQADVQAFLSSGAAVCECVLEGDAAADIKMAQSCYNNAARRLGVPVRVARRQNRLFLLRMDASGEEAAE